MDFVDLDKVLDEFEEEEKAALCIVPGQELKPSGYVEFLHKHQEQDWASINSTSFAPTSGYTLERRSVREPVNISYDDPYDGFSHSKLGFIQDPMLDSLTSQNGLDGKGGGKNQSELVTNLTSITADGVKTLVKRGTSERKGTIASKCTEVQTDALTPNSEQVLMSSPFPKSDILVEGHEHSAVNIENGRYSNTDTDRNSSPIYASMDSENIMATHSSGNSGSNYKAQSSINGEHMTQPFDQQEGMLSSPENVFKVSDAPVGFEANMGSGDLDDDAVDMYLNDLDEEEVGKTMLGGEEQSLSHQSGSFNEMNSVTNYGNGRSLADELKEAEPGTSGELDPSHHFQGQREESGTFSGQSVQNGVSSVNRSELASTNELKGHREAMFNSLISGKMEIEEILDDRSKQEMLSSRTSVGNSLLQSKPEIEGILEEVVQNQQNLSEQKSLSDQSSHVSLSNGLNPSLKLSDPVNDNSPSENRAISGEYGSMVMTMGVGARPKDPSVIKKNRPTSLLGLSKVSLDSPSAVVKQKTSDSESSPSDHINGELQSEPVLSDSEVSLRGETPPEQHSSDIETPPNADPGHKMKRPTTLNLPTRPEFNVPHHVNDMEQPGSEDLSVDTPIPPQTLTREEFAAGTPIPSQLPPTTDEASGIGQAIAAVPQSNPQHAVIQSNIGNVAPFWIPDAEAASCMMCQSKFTMWKRRHHCRACGKVLCATCCNQKAVLAYLENKEARVCIECYDHLSAAHSLGSSPHSPNPNNPNEYCSKVPPIQQASSGAAPPVVMVPTGVLKTSGSQRKSGEPKQVMFSDGIRPGGDLTELDGPDQSRSQRRSARAARRSPQHQGASPVRKIKEDSLLRSPCLIPEEGLPPLYIVQGETGYVEYDEALNQLDYSENYKEESGEPISFAVNKNLSVAVKIVNLDCCVNRVCWSFVSRGMASVGQSELVILLELTHEESKSDLLVPPQDVFLHFHHVYEEAMKGSKIENMGHSILQQSFLGSREHGGFLYLQSTFQCLNKLTLPEAPYLFGVLLQRWEAPWAKVFPIRLMLRLGAEYRYYPCPLVSVRSRKPVFYEVGHTIINLLADFRNFQYSLTQIRGVTIHMENKRTTINFPRNRYEDVMRVSRNSNEHVMALGSSFSSQADSHLVCIQNEDGDYQTQAINIQNKPRLVTGASFVVFNGALKTSAGLKAKLSIVEDGLMIQVLPEALNALKESLKTMTDFVIQCGPVEATEPEEVVELKWTDDDKNFNLGVKSFIDNQSLEGVEGMSVQSPQDFLGATYAIRWTRVYFLRHEDSTSSHVDPPDLSRVTEEIAQGCCMALVPHLEQLFKEGMVKLGLRVKLTRDAVGYDCGSKGQALPAAMMNSLDSFLIPIIHQAPDDGIVMELIFHIVE